MSAVEHLNPEASMQAFLNRLRTDRELLSSLIMSEDLKRSLAQAGVVLPEPIFIRFSTAIKRIRESISDQLHVFELKVQQVLRAVANSGNGGYW